MHTPHKTINLSHGSGGKAMNDLISSVFKTHFNLDDEVDQVCLELNGSGSESQQIAFTTDSFVVNPIEFPGGDIGKLAVFGTVNDLAVGGAKPLWLSSSFILEEGVEIEVVNRMALSMKQAAIEANVKIVTGDTKVVEKGCADKLFINTAGIGIYPTPHRLSPRSIKPGDVFIVNGKIGDHGAAIITARGEMDLEVAIESDCQPLNELMEKLMTHIEVRTARDATRGGVATVLNELAKSSQVGIDIDESTLPIKREVQGVCDILGLEPLYLANEGTLVVVVPSEQAEKALELMRSTQAGIDSKIIGKAVENNPGIVILNTHFGGRRVLDILVGDQLPRIC